MFLDYIVCVLVYTKRLQRKPRERCIHKNIVFRENDYIYIFYQTNVNI
jgi:hypothetical protein